MTKRIRAGRGIGDALYLQAIVRHLVARGEPLEVCTDYPELFRFPGLRFAPFSRANIRYTCHYTQAKHDERTHQFADMCRYGGIPGPVEFALDWPIQNRALVERVQTLANGRPILLVHGGREAFGRSDGYGLELLPDVGVFNAALALLRRQFYAVFCGKGRRLYPVKVDLDLSDQTNVTDLVDVAAIAQACYAQCSFVIPLAESLGKPLLVVFAARGFASAKQPVRTITPAKVLSKPSSAYFVDNWEAQRIDDVVGKFCDLGTGRGALSRQAGGDRGECAELPAKSAGAY